MFDKLSQIEEILKDINCESYILDIKLSNDKSLSISKKPEDKPKKIGFGD